MASVATDVEMVRRLCELANDTHLLDEARKEAVRSGRAQAIRGRDDAFLVSWLLAATSFQGISDANAQAYMDAHGSANAGIIAAQLARAGCPRLASYWHYDGCRYHKGSHTCAEPELIDGCALPTHDLRNGRLNQTAFAFTLFVRDMIQGDLVGWIDRQLAAASDTTKGAPPNKRWTALRSALLLPLGSVHGLSDKVLSMSLSDLLVAEPDRPLWLEAGAAMIAIDSLVHNWLHRTGIADRWGTPHVYGDKCYSTGGCAEIAERLAVRIDARNFRADYPKAFPRFVQKAIWSFCAGSLQNRCNGNRINDRIGCSIVDCPIGRNCDRRPLKGTA